MYTPVPTRSHPRPATATSTCSAVTVTKARKVPSPPRIANRGSSRPPSLTFPGPRYGRARSGSTTRRRMTARCAIVNDSIAPNAYMFPRKVAWPGIRVRRATPPHKLIPIHGARTQGSRKERRVDREHRADHSPDRGRNRPRFVPRLLGHVRDRLDPGVRDHPDGDCDHEVLPCRGGPEVDVVDERLWREHQHRADYHEQ